MLRALVKAGLAGVLHMSRADRLIGILAGLSHIPPVLCYHRVVEDFAAHATRSIPSMLISRRMLERHLDWIGQRFRFVSLDELGCRLDSGEPFDEPVTAVTFDDGYADVYHHAFPLLKRKGIPAAVFVVTDLVGTSRVQLYDRLYLVLARAFSAGRGAPHDLARVLLGLGITLPNLAHEHRTAWTPAVAMRALLNALPQSELARILDALEAEFEIDAGALTEVGLLNWDMLGEMHRAGMTIGSHTRTHPLLTNESRQKAQEETAGSRRALQHALGVPITHFAYPNGWFNPVTTDAVAEAGYRFAYTTCVHLDSRHPSLTIPRRLLWENSCLDALGRFSPSLMSCQMHSVFDVLAGCELTHTSPASEREDCAAG